MQSPLFCRSESSSDRVFLKMHSNPLTFRAAWTQFPMEPENEIAGLANGALCGQIFDHPVTREGNERGDRFDRNFRIRGHEISLFCAKGKPTDFCCHETDAKEVIKYRVNRDWSEKVEAQFTKMRVKTSLFIPMIFIRDTKIRIKNYSAKELKWPYFL